MLVRSATPADAPAIAHLNASVQQLHHREVPELFKPPDPDAYLPTVRAWLVRDERTALVAEDESGAVVGYALAHVRRREETPLTRASTVMELDEIAVQPGQQHRGIGTALVRQLVERARDQGADSVELTVHSFNHGACAFFEAVGLTASTTRMRLRLR